MSLILEALRKSEAERRLGSAPDVLSAMPVMRVSAPRSRWPLVFAIVAGIVMVAAAGLWWSQRSAVAVSTSIATTVPSQPKPASLPQAIQVAPAIPATALSSHPAPPEAPHPTAAPAPPAPPFVPSVITTQVDPASVPATAAPVATPTPASVANAEPALLSLSDLSADERAGLPALKVTMHVYGEDPAKRFMIVDGQRVGEGARFADGVVLVRIRRDGAELDLRGRRVLLPKP